MEVKIENEDKKDSEVLVYENNQTINKLINKNFKEKYLAKVPGQGISTLCRAYDKLTGGIQPGEIATIAGFTGSMKTTYSVNLGYKAMLEGKNVLFLSFEETAMNIYSKLLSRHSVTKGRKLITKDILLKKLPEDDEKFLVNELCDDLENQKGKFLILESIDFPSLNLNDIHMKICIIEKYLNEIYDSYDKGIDLIIVDHLQILKFNSLNYDEKSIMNEYVSFFNKLSKEFGVNKRLISIALISQMNREGYKYAEKNNGMYRLVHIAEANELERASDVIVTVYTDAQSQITKNLKLGAIKLRGAQLPLDTVSIFADGEYYNVGDHDTNEKMDYSLADLFGDITMDMLGDI